MDEDVKEKFDYYPSHIKVRMLHLRRMVYEAAEALEGNPLITETLKWGEPSYLTEIGSTIRMGWKPRSPEHYALYFNCNTSLVETFRVIYGNSFQYEKNRAIIFNIDDDLPEVAIKDCISMALQYHSIKHLPLLGR